MIRRPPRSTRTDTLFPYTTLFRSARRHDVILTIGGVSVGDHDLVKPAFLACRATLDFIKVALKPGKPLMAGRLGNALVLGLPGHPVSAYVTCFTFALPLFRKSLGASTPLPPVLPPPPAPSLP